jgi:hypothetical protein
MKQYNTLIEKMNRWTVVRKKAFCIIILIMFLVLTGCGPHIEGYGVILQGDKETGLKNNEIVKVFSESVIQNAFIVFREKPEEQLPVKKWRIKVFKNEKEAAQFATEYAPFAGKYAYSLKDGIPPVRETPENSSSVKIISKPKAYQPLKILGRTEDKVKINDMVDYWYHVLIEYQGIGADGQYKLLGGEGYCFGYSLELFETDGDPMEEIARIQEADKGEDPLDNLLHNVWRPGYFYEMIQSGAYDLGLFKSTIGLFPEPENQRLILTTYEKTYTYEYTDIAEVRNGLYAFLGADVRIDIYSNYRISLTYMAGDEQKNILYRKITADIDALIERELNRRKGLYEDFFLRGPVLSSSAYGKIILYEDNTFSWTGFNKLVPGVIPENVSGRGRIDFVHYLSSDLRDSYDGVITFFFNDYHSSAGINFLYKKTDDGVRLFFVSETAITKRIVKRTDMNPIVIFFTFNKS